MVRDFIETDAEVVRSIYLRRMGPAVEMGRKFVGAELKRSYFDQARRNLAAATEQMSLAL